MSEDIALNSELNQPKPAIKYGWLRALLYLLAALFSSMIGQVIGLIIVAIVFGIDIKEIMQDSGNIINNLGAWGYLILTLFGFLPMLLITWVFRKFIDKKSFVSLGFAFKKYKTDFIKGMIWGLGLIVFGFIILFLLGNLEIMGVEFLPLTILGYILMFIVVSLNEEIMVRGYLLNNLSQSVNRYIALMVTSLLFAILHLSNANISMLGFINIVLAGVLLGIYYIHKQNLWFPIGIHFTWNFFQGPVLGFEVSGNNTASIITQNIDGDVLLTGGEFGFEASLLATILIVLAIIMIHFRYKQDTTSI